MNPGFGFAGAMGAVATAGLAALASQGIDVAPRPQVGVQLKLVHQWGCSDCDGAEQLSAIRTLMVDPDGSVFVADRYEPFIRAWSRAGDLIAWFGRDGEGPGEMQGVSLLSSLPNGAIGVADARLLRWTSFELSGGPIRTARLGSLWTSIAFSASRRAVLRVGNPRAPCGGAAVHATSVDDSSSTLLAELADLPVDDGGCPRSVYSFAAEGDGSFAVGFGHPDYLVREYDPDGNLRREIRRDVPRTLKTEEELTEDTRFAERFGREVDPLRFHFYGRSLRYDSRGRLWVHTARGTGDETIFDVFEDGDLAAEVVVPLIVRVKGPAFDVSGEYLVVESADEAGSPRITLFQVMW